MQQTKGILHLPLFWITMRSKHNAQDLEIQNMKFNTIKLKGHLNIFMYKKLLSGFSSNTNKDSFHNNYTQNA